MALRVQVPPGVPSLHAEVAQLVEHDLAKVGVASSSLVFRSKERTAEKVALSFLFPFFGFLVGEILEVHKKKSGETITRFT